MARTVTDIYNAILADKAARPELSSLTTTSQTAIWRVWAYITAMAHHLLEKIFDAFKLEVNDLIASQKVHTGKWYQQKALEFQFDTDIEQEVVVDNLFKVYYVVIDPTKRVVTRASIREASRKIYVKLNKGTVPNLAVLTEAEISAFTAYINLIKDAGTKIIVQSFPAEKLIAKIEVDFSPSQGVVLADQVKNMIDDYLANLDYDGVLNVQALEAKILSDPRVRNIKINYLLATQNDGKPLFELYNLPQGINEKTYSIFAGHIILNRDSTEIILNAV